MHKTGGFLHIQRILKRDTKRARRDKECAPQHLMNVRQMKADCFTKRNSMDIIAIGSFASEVEIVLLHTLWVKRDAGRGTPA